MKKIVTFILVSVMLLSMCTGCGNTKTSGGNRDKNTLNISVFDGGYGTQYLETIAESFEAEYPGVDVVIETTDLFSEIQQQVEADRYVADIIITTSSYISYGAKGKVLDITDVYESYPYGEDGVKTIKEKLGETADANEFEGVYYQLPVHSGSTGLVYNKVYLDAIYGEGNYELPVTSNQLVNMYKDIKAKNGWATVYTCSTAAEYAVWLRDIWTAQYLGYEEYKNFYDISYTDASGNVKKAEKAEELSGALNAARKSALTSLAELMSSSLGYAPPSCASMTYQQAQAYFAGFTAQTDVKTVDGHEGAAFMINGDWLYGEIEKYGEEVELDVRFMRTPINSSIIDKLSTVTSEEQLVECVKYIDTVIDGAEGTRPAYLSDEDYNRLFEARRMVWTTHAQQIATIPTTCTDETIAKDFLRFLASDASALLYSDTLNGMKSVFSDTAYAENKQNNFTESLNEAFKQPLRVTTLSTPYTAYGELNFFRYYYFIEELYKCENVETTVKGILDWTEDDFSKSWQKVVESYQP